MLHQWETIGFKSPYKFLGIYSIPTVVGDNVNAYNESLKNKPNGFKFGTCQICNHSLVNNYMLEDADGIKFVVGCDCIEKSDGEFYKEIKKTIKKQNQQISYDKMIDNHTAKINKLYELHGELLKKCESINDIKINSILTNIRHYGSILPEQITQLNDLVAKHDYLTSDDNIHVGLVGDVLEDTLKVTAINYFKGGYGNSKIVTMKNSKGNILVYIGNSFNSNLNDVFKVTFKVTAHLEYNGVKQTKITRIKGV